MSHAASLGRSGLDLGHPALAATDAGVRRAGAVADGSVALGRRIRAFRLKMSEDDVTARLSKFCTLSELKTSGGGEPFPGELSRGVGWAVTGGAAGLMLHYISGELAGRGKTLPLSEAEALWSGGVSLKTLPVRRGAG